MSELITIPTAILDLSMDYLRPNLRLGMDRAAVVEQLFDRYGKWGIKVDDVEVVKEGKPSEQGIKLKLPKHRTSFFFSPSLCRLNQDNADWASAEQTMEILDIGIRTLAELAGVKIATYKASISLHMQPKAQPFIELLRPFANSRLTALEQSPLKAFATVVKWEGRRITIDGSAQLANGIFLRFERDFPGKMAIEQIARQLRADESELFSLLGVEEDQS